MRLIPRAILTRTAPGRILAALLLSGALAGCITLLPKERAVQLYRFGGGQSGAASVPASGSPFTVRAVVGSFAPAAAGDQILTVTGERTAYIAGARWVSPARALFETALSERFAEAGGPARLLDRGELVSADARLDLAVTRFETRYEGGPPETDIRIDAALNDVRAAGGRKARVFEVATPAAANTQTAIVAAYGEGVSRILSQIIAWVDARGAA
jgi:cholesterol transport system auxiliary component